MLGGASLTTEKTYLVGKFARVALRTRHVDYNGRLCMVSAAAANKKAFGLDRAGNPWADMLETDLIVAAGTNIAECFPVMMQYVWGARDRGAKLIVVDPRETPMARTADEHVALRPGTDTAFFNGVLHVLVREGMTDERFIADHTVGWEDVRDAVAAYDAASASARSAASTRARSSAWRRCGATAAALLGGARARDRAAHPGRRQLPRVHQRRPSPPGQIGRVGRRLRDAHRPGQRPGRPRARPEVRHAPRRPRPRRTPSTAPTSPASGASTRPTCRSKGTSMMEMVHQMARGEIRGLLGMCNNPFVSLPHHAVVRAGYDALEFHAQSDFFLSETAAARRRRAAGHGVGRGRGRHGQRRGPGDQVQQGRRAAGRGAAGLVDHVRARPPPGRRATSSRSRARARCSTSCASPRRAATPTTTASPTRRSRRPAACSGRARTSTTPGTPRPFEGGSFYGPDGRAMFNAVEWSPPAEPPDDEYPLRLTTGRTVAHFLSGNQTRRLTGAGRADAAPVGRGPSVARLRRRRPGQGRQPPRRGHVSGARHGDDPPGHGLHPVPLGRRRWRPT